MSVKTQFDNLGDALINRELCRLAAARVRTYVDFSRAPVEFERAMRVAGQQNLQTLRRFGYVRLLALMTRFRLSGTKCYFFLNPGGLGGKRKSLRSLLSALAYNCVLSVLRLFGVRICHVGISFDEMDRAERFSVSWRRRLLHAFAVRDRMSEAYLHRIGIEVDEIVPDLSFNLYETDAANDSPRASIAFSFRFDGKSDEADIVHAVRTIIEDLGSGYTYVFVVQVARDEAGMRRLAATCSGEGITTRVLVCFDDIDALSSHYRQCSAVYSNRLHALLLATYSGASPYALLSPGAQPKIEGMFSDLGLADRLYFIDKGRVEVETPTAPNRGTFTKESARLHHYFDRLLDNA